VLNPPKAETLLAFGRLMEAANFDRSYRPLRGILLRRGAFGTCQRCHPAKDGPAYDATVALPSHIALTQINALYLLHFQMSVIFETENNLIISRLCELILTRMRIRAREAPAIKSYTKTYRTCTQTSIIVNVTQLRRKI